MAPHHPPVKRGSNEIARGVASMAQQERERLLEPETLRNQIRFEGNRPYLDPEYRRRLVATTVVAVAADAASSNNNKEFFLRNVKRIVALPKNIIRIRLNRQVTEKLAKRLDCFDDELVSLSTEVDPNQNPELWGEVVASVRTVLAEDLDKIWVEYERKYEEAVLVHLLPTKER